MTEVDGSIQSDLETKRLFCTRNVYMKHSFRDRSASVLLLMVCLMFSGCALFQEDPETLTIDSDHDRAFNEVRNVLSSRFEVKTADRENGRIETTWRMKPSEMGTKRKRMMSTVSASEDHPDQIRITLRSEVQQVSDMLRPYETEEADWESAARDRELEKDLVKLIEFRLKSKEMETEIIEEIEEGSEQDRRLEELKRGEEDVDASDE